MKRGAWTIGLLLASGVLLAVSGSLDREPAATVDRLGRPGPRVAVGWSTRPVLERGTVALRGVSASRVLLAAGRPGKGGAATRCHATLATEDGERAVAELAVPAGPGRWIEAEARLPAIAEGTLRLRCEDDATADPAVVWARPILAPLEASAPPLLVLISLDTLRADHVPGFGGPPEMAPALGRLGAEGIRFTNAQANGTWTLPSHYSLMASRLIGMKGSPKLPEGLAAALADAGLVTVGLTGGGWVSWHRGFDQGFDHYGAEQRVGAGVPELVGDTLVWLDRLEDVPTFLFLHTYAVHAPSPAFKAWLAAQGESGMERYRPGAAQLAADAAHYAALVRSADRDLTPLFDRLRSESERRPVLLVVLSDHGEAFGEHDNYGHGMISPNVTLHDEVLRIPVIVWGPGLVPSGRTSSRPIGLVDVAPSLISAVGGEVPSTMRGESLWPLWSGKGPMKPDSEAAAVSHLEGVWAFRTDRYKLIVRMAPDGRDHFTLFDLREDAGERHDLASERPELVVELARRLRRELGALGVPHDPGEDRYAFPRGDCGVRPIWLRCGEDAFRGMDGLEQAFEIRAQQREQLRALGYHFD